MTKPVLLIVDDEQDLAEVLQETFAHCGFDVQMALNVDTAMRLLEEKSYDLVLSDVRMPLADGIELIERLSDGRYPKLGIFLMSGFLDISLPEALDRGALGLFQKPMNLDDVEAAFLRQLKPPQERWSGSPGASDKHLERQAPVLEFGRGGFFLAEQNLGLKPGSTVSFDFRFGKESALVGTGRVVWNRDVARSVYGPGCGILFETLRPEAVAHYLAARGEDFVKAVVPLGIPKKYR